MRFFALVAITAVCSILTAAAPAAGNESNGGTEIASGGTYNDTQPTAHTTDSKTITLGLGVNGINVGESKTLYQDVQAAIEHLCPRNGGGCVKTSYTFPVMVTTVNVNPMPRPQPFLTRIRLPITVTVEDAYWGGHGNVYEVLRNTIAAAFDRGPFDPGNCATRTINRKDFFRDCMTVDYAEVILSGGYKMKVKFTGPKSGDKNLKFDCQREVDDAFAFVRDDVEWKGTPWVYCIGVDKWPRRMT